MAVDVAVDVPGVGVAVLEVVGPTLVCEALGETVTVVTDGERVEVTAADGSTVEVSLGDGLGARLPTVDEVVGCPAELEPLSHPDTESTDTTMGSTNRAFVAALLIENLLVRVVRLGAPG